MPSKYFQSQWIGQNLIFAVNEGTKEYTIQDSSILAHPSKIYMPKQQSKLIFLQSNSLSWKMDSQTMILRETCPGCALL